MGQDAGSYICCMQDADKQIVPLADYKKLETEVEGLKQRIAWFERQLFGQKSERFVPTEELPGQLMLAFDPEHTQAVDESVRQVIEAHERKVHNPAQSGSSSILVKVTRSGIKFVCEAV